MRKSNIFIFTLLFTVICFTGCSNKDNEDQKTSRTTTNSKATASNSLTLKSDEVSEGINNEGNLRKSFISQIKWELSDGSVIKPSNSSILWDANFRGFGLVINKIPKLSTSDNPYYYLCTNYWKEDVKNKSKRWFVKGIGIINDYKSEYKLKNVYVPMKNYSVISFDHRKELGYEAWFVVGRKEAIAIGKYPKESFKDNKWDRTMLGNKQGYINSNGERTSLAYVESKYLVTVTGNIDVVKLKKVAESLPSLNDEKDFLPHKEFNQVLNNNVNVN